MPLDRGTNPQAESTQAQPTGGDQYRNGSLPFRDLVPFLDYCAERIFLRKVGGGYIFVHRLLMEHFASLYDTPPTEKSG